MNESVIRGSGGLQWQEPQLTTRVPPVTGVVPAVVTGSIALPGERTEPQRLADFDGVYRMVTLPVREGAGEWRAIVEDGKRLYAYQRRDGSRSVICLD